MKHISNRVYITICLLWATVGASAQLNGDVKLHSPFDFDLLLSANFGELRSDHFHAGVDFKTQGVTGKEIKCVADGYICRAKVDVTGYGQALYVMHDGFMTVYAHLDRFPDGVAERVRKYQYSKERFDVEVNFKPGEFPVKAGELLAYAGNTGYSFGPHLHFELRDGTGNELYNPLPFYKDEIEDTRAPKATAIVVYPRQGKGALSARSTSRVFKLRNGVLADTIDAWGDIAFAVEALDYMDNTTNKYGIYRTELLVDGKLYFESQMDNISFNENKLILSFLDKGRERRDEGVFQKLFVAPNNNFRELKTGGSKGWVTIDQERLYKVECRLVDYHGNSCVLDIVVRGKRCEIAKPSGDGLLSWRSKNTVSAPGARLVISKGELFDDACLTITNDSVCTISGGYASTGEEVFFRRGAQLSLSAAGMDVADKSKLYIYEIEEDENTWIRNSRYADGYVVGKISSQGRYAIGVDTVPPVLRPVNEKKWMKNAMVVFELYDDETRATSFHGTLDGEFVLFGYNRKNRRLTLDLQQENIKRGSHELKVVATDACGNSTVFEKSIEY